MKRLIIGGPHDGQWYLIPKSVGDRVELINPRDEAPTIGEPVQPFETTIYHAHRLDGGDGRKHTVFAADGVNVIERLILGYRKEGA
jgi:hypothetical protein